MALEKIITTRRWAYLKRRYTPNGDPKRKFEGVKVEKWLTTSPSPAGMLDNKGSNSKSPWQPLILDSETVFFVATTVVVVCVEQKCWYPVWIRNDVLGLRETVGCVR